MSNDFPSRHSSRNNRPTPRRDTYRRTADRDVVQSDELSSTSGARLVSNNDTFGANFSTPTRRPDLSSELPPIDATRAPHPKSPTARARNSAAQNPGFTGEFASASSSQTGNIDRVHQTQNPRQRPSVRKASGASPRTRRGRNTERVNVGHTGQFTTVTAGQTGEFARIPSDPTGEFARIPSDATGGFSAVSASQTGGFSPISANQTGRFSAASSSQTDNSTRIPLNDPSFEETSFATDASIPRVASYGNDNNSYQPYQTSEEAPFRGFHAAQNGSSGTMSPIYVKPQHSHRRKKTWPRVVVVIAILLAVGFGGFFGYQQILYGGPVTATVNGETMTLEGNERTINGLLDNGVVKVAPGNFVAVDNSIIEEGNGTRATALINEKQTDDLDAHIMEGDVVVVSSGSDVMEAYTDSDPIVVPATSERVGSYGALHVFLDGQDGEKVTRTGSTSGITVEAFTKETINERLAYYNANSNGEKVIALTFDDGPNGSTTDEILDILKANDAKATFYTIGENASTYPNQLKRAASEGHEIATHTWDHAGGSGKGVSLDLMSSDERVQEVEQGNAIIKELTGEEPSVYFRAPGGNFGEATANDLKALISGEIGWNVDTQDWRRPGAEVIFQRILNVKPGEIILMHDGGGDRSQTVAALRDALPILKEQGYKFVTITELIEQYPYQGA